MLLQIVFGLSAAIVFALKGYTAFSGREDSPIFSVAYVLFWLVRLIITFSSYAGASVLAETIFEMLALSATLVFFFNVSAIENDIGAERRLKTILPLSIATILSGGVYSVSQVIVIFSGRAQLLHSKNASLVTNVAVIIYVIFFTVLSYKKTTEEETPQEIIEE